MPKVTQRKVKESDIGGATHDEIKQHNERIKREREKQQSKPKSKPKEAPKFNDNVNKKVEETDEAKLFETDPIKSAKLFREKMSLGGDKTAIEIYKKLDKYRRNEFQYIVKNREKINKFKDLINNVSELDKGDPFEIVTDFFKQLNRPDGWGVIDLYEAEKMPDLDPLIRLVNKKGAFLSKQEIACISGAGGTGKSIISLQVAIAASLAHETPQYEYGIETAGFRVAKGNTLILGYEDYLKRVTDRIKDLLKSHDFKKLYKEGSNEFPPEIQNDPQPWDRKLYAICRDHLKLVKHKRDAIYGFEIGDIYGKIPAPIGGWDALWEDVERHKIDLITIDPVLASYIAEQNSAAFVRAFMNELYVKAEELNCGLLLVSHSTKANRQDRTDTTGAVSGSAAWLDAARSVAILQHHMKETPIFNDNGKLKKVEKTIEPFVFDLQSVKANYSEPFNILLHKEQEGITPGFYQDKENKDGKKKLPKELQQWDDASKGVNTNGSA